MIFAGLFSNVLSPVYQLSFTPDIWSILICLIIAFFGTAFAFFISMKAVSLVSPLVVSVISASEPLSSALLSVLFLGLGSGLVPSSSYDPDYFTHDFPIGRRSERK